MHESAVVVQEFCAICSLLNTGRDASRSLTSVWLKGMLPRLATQLCIGIVVSAHYSITRKYRE
jgi:hypothetical protein